MASLAARLDAAGQVANDPRIRVCALETAFRSRYTVDTLAILQQRFPKLHFVWLMGADNMVQMPRWYRWTRLFHTVPIAIFDRDTYAVKAVTGVVARRFSHRRVMGRRAAALAVQRPPAWSFLSIRRHPASATALRDRGLWPSA
jgi:nicotinate-nucleotide adenylyltransferase